MLLASITLFCAYKIGEFTTRIECNPKWGETDCELYNKGIFSEQQYVESIELSRANGNELIKIADACIEALTNRTDILEVCEEVMKE